MLMQGAKQSFPNITTTTSVAAFGFLKNVFGARYVLVRAFNAVQTGVVTITADCSIDGINTATGVGVVAWGGAGRADGTQSYLINLCQDAVGGRDTLFTVPFIRLIIVQATTGGLVQVEAWPLFDVFHPSAYPYTFTP